VEHLNLRQDGTNSSVCLGMMLKNKRETSDTTVAFLLFFMAFLLNTLHSCSSTIEGNTFSCTFSYTVSVPASHCHINARSVQCYLG
jgi:hypothetical protein